MNSLSENNNSTYQPSKVITLSSVTNMTTSPTLSASPIPADDVGIDTKNVNEIWKNNFNSKNANNNSSRLLDLNNTKISSWANINNNNMNNNNDQVASATTMDTVVEPQTALAKNRDDDDSDTSVKSNASNNGKIEVEKCSNDDGNDTVDANACPASPPHHARRPMNAFLIFCKKHRPIVRNKFPTLENRGVTRILGEWWSLLDSKDKDPYTLLAKQYKDAFFTANPDFKWYKLPAPPLRTLPTRPTKNEPSCSALSPPISPTNLHVTMVHSPSTNVSLTSTTTNAVPSSTADFTPGKLADESQLGMLSSLLHTANSFTNNNSHKTTTNDNESSHNNNNTNDNEKTPPGEKPMNDVPPKPLKKRPTGDSFTETVTAPLENHQMLDANNKLVRNLFDDTKDYEDTDVRHEYDDGTDMTNGANGRKSVRKGKGNRYADIMANGKLIKNKRSSTDKLHGTCTSGDSPPSGGVNVTTNAKVEKLDLNNTIKRLEERISSQNTTTNTTPILTNINNNSNGYNNATSKQMTNDNKIDSSLTATATTTTPHCNNNSIDYQLGESQRTRTISEVSDMSDVGDYSKAIPSFDLDARIAQLPNLLYDTYVQRKKDMKKRKTPKAKAVHHVKEKRESDKGTRHTNEKNDRKRTHDETKEVTTGNNTVMGGHKATTVTTAVEKQTGSKKRKNKHNITHLENNSLVHSYDNDLSGLTTLAEIAAHKQKLDDANTNCLSLSKTNQNNNNNNNNT